MSRMMPNGLLTFREAAGKIEEAIFRVHLSSWPS